MSIEPQPVPPENTPRPFVEIPGLWLRLPQMGEDFFDREILRTSGRNAFFSMLVLSVIASAMSVLVALLGAVIGALRTPGTANSATFASGVGILTLSLCCFEFILPPVSLYFSNGLLYVSASIFGGKGKFTSQAYLSSLYIVPLTVVSLLGLFFALIPGFGSYISNIWIFVVALLHIVYTVRMLVVVHNFTKTRAVAALFAPVVLLLIPVCLILVLTVMGPVIGHVFSTINANSLTPLP